MLVSVSMSVGIEIKVYVFVFAKPSSLGVLASGVLLKDIVPWHTYVRFNL